MRLLLDEDPKNKTYTRDEDQLYTADISTDKRKHSKARSRTRLTSNLTQQNESFQGLVMQDCKVKIINNGVKEEPIPSKRPLS